MRMYFLAPFSYGQWNLETIIYFFSYHRLQYVREGKNEMSLITGHAFPPCTVPIGGHSVFTFVLSTTLCAHRVAV